MDLKTTLIPAALAAAITLGTTPALAAAPTFADVPEAHWAYPYVEQAYAAGAVNGTGYDEGTGVRLFSPAIQLNAAQWLTMCLRTYWPERLADQPSGQSPWYAGTMAVAEELGLTDVLGGESPTKPLTRNEMALLTDTVLKKAGAHSDTDILNDALAKTPDIGIIPVKYKLAVLSMVGRGIITGVDSKGTFNGDGTFTRVQAATVYCRMTAFLPARNDAGNGGQTPVQPTPDPEQTIPQPGVGACCPADANADGIVTDEEVTDFMFGTLKNKYPDLGHYEPYAPYSSPVWPSNGIECAKLAMMLSDEIYGRGPMDMPVTVHHDITKIRPGDVIHMKEETHWAIATSTPRPQYEYGQGYEFSSVDGGASGCISWSENSYIPDFLSYDIYTRTNG